MTVLNFCSRLHEADKSFDRIPIYYQDTVKYIDPITRQTFNYASSLSCDKYRQEVMALDLDAHEHCVLTPKLLLRSTPMLPETKQPAKKTKHFHCTRS